MNRLFPASSCHGSSLSRTDDNYQLSDSQHLHIDNIRRPEVWSIDLSNVKKDRLGEVTPFLSLTRLFDKSRDYSPNGRSIGSIGIILSKIEGTRAIRCTGSKGVTQSSWTSVDIAAISQRKAEIGHVLESVERLDCGPSHRNTIRIEGIVQSPRSIELSFPNLVA